MTAAEKARLMASCSAGVRALAAAGVERRRGRLDDVDALIELGRVLYGPEVITDEVAAAVRRTRAA